jgi:transposase
MNNGKLNEEVIKKAANMIRAGNYQKVVAQALGVSEVTWYNWLKRGEQEANEGKDTLRAKFFKEIKRAEAEAIIRNVAIIQKAAATTWQAAAWWLERRYPDEWGKKDTTTISADNDTKIVIKINKVSRIKDDEDD